MQAWLHFADRESTSHQREITQGLNHSGVQVADLDDCEPRAPGLLCFSCATAVVRERVETLSRGGRHGILALSMKDGLRTADAWQLLHAGASDVLTWKPDGMLATAIAARIKRWQEVEKLLESPVVCDNLVGSSVCWRAALRRLVELARFTDANALILGESGTGKELAARLIHTLDPRTNKAELVVLDCTTIVPELSGSEFFGHERGAFTGATSVREGAFALANGGTLFLDEVGELPLPLQAQLLRAIQERTFKRVGGNEWQRTDFRLVCATNRNLIEEVRRGRFRHDLYHRIANWTTTLPPLRDRPEDIVSLFCHFVKQNGAAKSRAPEIDAAVREYLTQRSYHGNVRELRQMAARMIHAHIGPGPISIGDIAFEDRPVMGELVEDWRNGSFEAAIRRALCAGAKLRDIKEVAEDIALRLAVTEADGNLQRAAARLGVTDRMLQLRRAAERKKLPRF